MTAMARVAAMVAVAILAFASPARADKDAAKRHFERGTRAYNLGRFEQAIDHFEQAYEAHPAPVFLFNIAQAHRLAGHCDKATFFYRRFLSEDPDTRARAEIEQHVASLAECAEAEAKAEAARVDEEPTRNRTEAPSTPLTVASRVDPEAGTSETGAPGDGPPPDPRGVTPVPAEQGATERLESAQIIAPRDAWLEARLEGGAAVLLLGDLDVPVQGAAAVTAGYPVRFERLALTCGLFANLTSVPYEGASSGTALLVAFGAHADARYFVAERVALRAGAGAGVLLLSGLESGNPITKNGNPTSGALSLFALRAQLGVDVFLNDHVALALTPVSIGFSPRRSDLAEAITRVLRIELVGGLAIFL